MDSGLVCVCVFEQINSTEQFDVLVARTAKWLHFASPHVKKRFGQPAEPGRLIGSDRPIPGRVVVVKVTVCNRGVK